LDAQTAPQPSRHSRPRNRGAEKTEVSDCLEGERVPVSTPTSCSEEADSQNGGLDSPALSRGGAAHALGTERLWPPEGAEVRGSQAGHSEEVEGFGHVRRGLKVKLDESFARLASDSGDVASSSAAGSAFSGQDVDQVGSLGESGREGGSEVGSPGRSDTEESEFSSVSTVAGSTGQSGTPWGSTAGDLLRCNPLFELRGTFEHETTSEDSEI
jgi:hypothetical protein